MKVKCPKCRLRFDMPTAPGITEVQCFCPRCGTPFTYSLEDESQDNDGQETDKQETKEGKDIKEAATKSASKQAEGASTQADSASTQADGASTRTKDASTKTKKGGDDTKSENSTVRADGHQPLNKEQEIDQMLKEEVLSNQHPLDMREVYRRHSNRHAYMFLLGIIFSIIMVGLFAKGIDMFVGHFTDNDEALSASLAVDSVLSAKEDSINGKGKTAKQKKHKKKEEKEKKGENGKKQMSEALPQWLQGKWHVYTSNGYIRMNIRGSAITVSDSKHSNSGTAHCRGNLLVCKFHDGRTFTYNIDNKTHHILLEFGMEMTKEK